MKIAILAVGLPGSGKTTLLKPIAEQYGLAYINRDDIRAEFWGDATDQSNNKKVWQEANRRTAAALNEGRNVVLDSTFVETWKRKETITFLRESGAERIIAIYADVPIGIAKERNTSRDRKVPEEVIIRMHEELIKNPPSLEEGFDTIYTFSEIEEFEKEL